MRHVESLERVIKEVLQPSAVAVDRDAAFPRNAVKALGKAGLLGLTSAKDVGGMGLGLAEAAQVVEKTRYLRVHCDDIDDALLH